MRSTPADGPAAPIIRPYYDSLDGLRALAFLAVFGWHCVRMVSSSRVFDWGWTGVDLFFVLSGFLITGILFDSLGRGFYFRNFYARRTLRIFPLFYSVWFALLLLTPILQVHWNRYNVLEAIYLGNFFTPAGVLGKHPLPGSLSYGLPWRPGYRGALLVDHFWSLCVEEQYYLVWPAVIYFVRARGRLLAICALGILGSPLLRVAIVHFAPAQLEAYGLYYPTYVRCDGLLSGSALALVLRSPSALSISRLRQAAWCCAAVALAVMVLVVYCRGGIGHVPIVDPFVCTFGYSLIALMACSILLLSILPSSGLPASCASVPWWRSVGSATGCTSTTRFFWCRWTPFVPACCDITSVSCIRCCCSAFPSFWLASRFASSNRPSCV